jgi:hypothetical protein
MAEKHKSKYKKPENAKPTRRKDLKDYTYDDKVGALNPYSTGKKQERVARKTDKAIQDDGKLFPKYTEKDRLYKKLEDGEYDPKHAMNVLRKRQEVDTDDYFDAREKIDHGVTTSELEERINKLSNKQKERLVREYLRRKIVKILREQDDPNKPADEPADEPTPPAPATPTPPAPAEPTPPAPTPPTPPAPAAPTEPAPKTPESEPKKSAEEKNAEQIVVVKNWLEYLKTKQQKGPSTLIQTAIAPMAAMIKKLSPEDAERAKKLAIRQIRNITIETTSDEEDAES